MTDSIDVSSKAPVAMPRVWRLLMAAVVAPLTVTLIVGAFMLVDGVVDRFTLGITLIATLLGYAGSLFIGLPLALLLRRSGQLDALTLCMGGIMAGPLVLGGTLWWISGDLDGKDDKLWSVVLGTGFGLAVAIAFCLLAWIPLRRFARRRGPAGE